MMMVLFSSASVLQVTLKTKQSNWKCLSLHCWRLQHAPCSKGPNWAWRNTQAHWKVYIQQSSNSPGPVLYYCVRLNNGVALLSYIHTAQVDLWWKLDFITCWDAESFGNVLESFFFFLCHTGFDSEQCPENTIKHCTPDARGHAALSHLSPQPPFKQFPCQELDEKTDPRSHICITDMQPQPARTHLQDRYDVELLLFLNVPVPFGCTWMCFQSSQRSISYMQDFPLVC